MSELGELHDESAERIPITHAVQTPSPSPEPASAYLGALGKFPRENRLRFGAQ